MSYTQKTLMQNERIIYSAKGHFFNYFTSVLAIYIGLILTDVIKPTISDNFKNIESVGEVQKNIDDKKRAVSKKFNKATGNLRERLREIAKEMPEELKWLADLLYSVRLIYFGLIFLFIGFVGCIRVFIKMRTDEYCVTSKRVVYKFGFLTTDTREINLDRIEGVKVKQSFIDKIVNRGNLLINGIGTEQVEMKKISKPAQLRIAILEAVSQYSKS